MFWSRTSGHGYGVHRTRLTCKMKPLGTLLLAAYAACIYTWPP